MTSDRPTGEAASPSEEDTASEGTAAPRPSSALATAADADATGMVASTGADREAGGTGDTANTGDTGTAGEAALADPPKDAAPQAGGASEAAADHGAESAADAPGAQRPTHSAGVDEGRGARSAAAEALAAAVRAVERGEADAASFFNRSSRRAAPAGPAAPTGDGAPGSPRHPGPTGPGPTAAHAEPRPGDGSSYGGAPARPRPEADTESPAHTSAGEGASAVSSVGGRTAGPGAGDADSPATDGEPTRHGGASRAAAEPLVPGPADARPADGAAGQQGRGPQGPSSGGPAANAPAEQDETSRVLAAGGAPEQLAGPVVRALGERAAETLRADPWQLLAVFGVRPEQADGFARALLGSACGPGDERRSRALVTWLLERAALEGHTALESATLRDALGKQSVPDPDQALREAIAEGGVLVFQDALETPGTARAAADDEDEQPVRVLLGLDRYALAEESLADGLARLINTFEAHEETDTAPPASDAPSPDANTDADTDTDVDTDTDSDGDGDGDITVPDPDATAGDQAASPAVAVRQAPTWEAVAEAAPAPSAAELIRAVASNGVVAHSGGEAARAEPVALIAAAQARGLRAYAAAHTDDGKRRLAAACEAQGLPAALAVTVTELLAGSEGPGRNAEGALALDVLAVLDAPQLDVESAAALVESLSDGARLVLSGDPGVLWSAGPGRVFADLLAARACPQVVSRTPDPGPIGELVSGIGVGELNQVEAPGKEVVIVPVRDAGEAVHRTVQLVADSVPRVIGVAATGTQVITVAHGGAVGSRALNAALKERINPGPGRFGGFDPGDRIAYAVAPGRAVTGTVVAAEPEGLRIDCAGEELLVPRARVADALRHGWAITAHQAVGGRWPAAVVVLPGDAGSLLTRAWIYTAFSRGERHLSVVHGAGEELPRAVAEVPAKERTTRLRALLQAQSPAM
ncbi:helix-hairpin-helix domain-containing protein [Streptomyces zagrosensis]|uniref:RecD helicase-like helix-hairpin-helix domain-containing protein n=1 Tax=Streptomyces zagrosensis TaxID=1042984 RepID=A0A7W9V150_9ACTN|nr:helix-hairpin-helix domain-containing protein [Streptomyces zagrosensis]MBB5938820.1 hypothetical protein [Streptomyces zagrosensis]